MFLAPPPSTAFVVSLLDSCSRLAWAEVVTSKKALPVMFKTLKMINTLNVSYGVQFARPDVAGKGSRLSMPLTWGGTKQAGVQFEKHFEI